MELREIVDKMQELVNIGILIKANRIKAENEAKEIYKLIEKFDKSMSEFDDILIKKGIMTKPIFQKSKPLTPPSTTN